MTTLWLARHGETQWNHEGRYVGWTDMPLNTRGEAQALQLQRRLKAQNCGALYTSDLRRCVDTARIALPGLIPHATADLRELRFGLFEGMTYDEALAQHPQALAAWVADPECAPPQGETLSTLAMRVNRFLDEIRTQDGACCVIAHSGSLRVLLCLALELPLSKHWQFRLDACSLTQLDLYPEAAILSRLNDTAHLENLS